MSRKIALSAGIVMCLYALNIFGSPDVIAACTAEATAYLLQAQNAQNVNDGITAYQNALRRDPACSNAYVNLSVVYMDANRFEDAITLLEKGSSIIPDNRLIRQNLMAAYINLGYNYAQAGHYQQAIPLYEKALNIDPENSIAIGNISSAYTNLGVQFYNQGEDRTAWEMFCRAVAIDPQNQAARTNLRNLFTEECPTSFDDAPAPFPTTQDIRAMLLQAIAAWQDQTGRSVNDGVRDRMINEYLSSVEHCGTMVDTIRQEDLNGLVAVYLTLLQDGRKATLMSCDPLR